MPKVTVLLPVFNAERFLKEAIDSILKQDYTDFELLIIDDGSTDRSPEIIAAYTDERIRLVRHAVNQQLIATLNEGIEIATGEYIARMDADDVALPKRLRIQVEAMDANPNLALCGTYYKGHHNDRVSAHLPESSEGIKAGLLFSCVLAHPTVMFRKSALVQANLKYNSAYPHAEDYELWSRLAASYATCNIRTPLLRYRHHAGQVSSVYAATQRDSMHKCQVMQLEKLGIPLTPEKLNLHFDMADLNFKSDISWVEAAGDWLLEIWKANQQVHVYDKAALHQVLMGLWYNICSHLHEQHLPVRKLFFESKLAKTLGIPARYRLFFRVKYQTGLWKFRQR